MCYGGGKVDATLYYKQRVAGSQGLWRDVLFIISNIWGREGGEDVRRCNFQYLATCVGPGKRAEKNFHIT